MLLTSGFDSSQRSGSVKPADSICYPVKRTSVMLAPSSDVSAAVGFPVSTTVKALREPDTSAVQDDQTGYPVIPTASVLGASRTRLLARADHYPLRTTSETLAGDEPLSSAGPQPAARQIIAPSVPQAAVATRRNKRKPRSRATKILSAVLVLSCAAPLAWMSLGLPVGDLQPIAVQILSDNLAHPHQQAGLILETAPAPTNMLASPAVETERPPGGASNLGSVAGSVQAESAPREVLQPADESGLTQASPDAPEPSPEPARDSLDVAAAHAISAIDKADATSVPPRLSDARTLLVEGQRRLRSGDILGARDLFGRAVDLGMANAALALGTTYDPRSLADLGALHVAPDKETALSWYRRAHVMARRETAASPSANTQE